MGNLFESSAGSSRVVEVVQITRWLLYVVDRLEYRRIRSLLVHSSSLVCYWA